MHSLQGNTLGIIGLVLLLFPFAAWLLVFNKQFEISTPKTYRVNVLIARTALYLPLYAIFVWVSLIEPVLYDGLQILFAIVEGYSFYSMFALVVSNLGGPHEAVAALKASNRPPFCPCCPTDPVKFYTQVLNSFWYFLFVRVVIVIVATIAAYKHIMLVYLITTLVALGILIYSLVSLVNFYENVFHLNMGHTFKIVTLKVSIGIIVIQGKGNPENIGTDFNWQQVLSSNSCTCLERLTM